MSHRLHLVSAPPEQRDLSTTEVAAQLGVTERTVRRAIARGELLATRQGGGYRIHRHDLSRYLARQERRMPSMGSPPLELALPNHYLAPLPTPLSSYIGREAIQASICRLLIDPSVRLVTLTGPGGVGKTRLSIAAAASIGEQFRSGVVFVALAAVTQRDQVMPAIADALGIQEIAGRNRIAQVRAFLRERRLLLVLDNFEQVVDAAPEVAALAGAAPGLTMLVTSRAPLRVNGEHECQVPPMTLAREMATRDEVLACDAGQLFAARAREHQGTFAVDRDSAPLIAEICSLLDGLPLAIELAAARVSVLSLPAMRAQLQRRLPFLTAGTRDAPLRHATMRDAIAWSYDLLSQAEQALFRQLSVFTGGFTLHAVERLNVAIAGETVRRQDGKTENEERRTEARHPNSLDLLAALVEQSLVTSALGSDGRPRYVMLETIREFGLEQLRGEEAVAARAAHARFFREMASDLGPLLKTRATWDPVARLAADDDNLNDALEWFATGDDAISLVRMVAACYTYMFARSHFRDAEAWIDRASAMATLVDDADRAQLLIAQAELQMVKGVFDEATVRFADALPLARTIGNPFHLALALISAGAAMNYDGGYDEGIRLLREALDRAAAVDDPTLRAAIEARALANLSVSARGLRSLEEAVSMAERALRLCQAHHFELATARTLMDLGDIAKDEGDYVRAVSQYRECIEQHGERGELRLLVDGFAGIASAATVWGHYREALLLFGAALAIRERIGYDMLLPLDVSFFDRDFHQSREAVGEREAAAILLEGRALSHADVMALVATIVPPSATLSRTAPPLAEELTQREQEVFQHLRQGHTDREIAAALYLSPRTVSWHVRAILAKVGASTRREAVAMFRDQPLA